MARKQQQPAAATANDGDKLVSLAGAARATGTAEWVLTELIVAGRLAWHDSTDRHGRHCRRLSLREVQQALARRRGGSPA